MPFPSEFPVAGDAPGEAGVAKCMRDWSTRPVLMHRLPDRVVGPAISIYPGRGQAMELAVTETAAYDRSTPRWRMYVFRAIAVIYILLGLVVLEGVTEGLMPWTTIGCPGCMDNYNPELHRWYGAMHGAMIAILFSGSMFALLLKPLARPLLLQFYVLGFLILATGFTAVSFQEIAETKPGVMIPFGIAMAIIVVAYPSFSRFKSFARDLPASIPLLALTAVSGLILAPQIWQDLQRQLDGTSADEHAVSGRWIESVIVMTVLIVAGLLTSTRRPGWTVLGTLLGVAYVYLGISAITVPDQPGGWGELGGIAALAGGLAYLGLTYRESRAVQPAIELSSENLVHAD